MTDLAIQRNNLEYIIELREFVYEVKKESIESLIKDLKMATSFDFFPYANALLILLEILPNEEKNRKKNKKRYLKEVLPMIYRFLKRYDLELMSKLPSNDLNKAVAGKIYLSSDNDTYVVRDPKGVVWTGSLKDSGIDLNNLPNRLNDPALEKRILEVTSKAGHTPLIVLKSNDSQTYIKKLFFLNPSIRDLTTMAIEKKLNNLDRFFTLLSNADLRLELKYATSLYHQIRNKILTLFLDLANLSDNVLFNLPEEVFFSIIELSFDLSVANITRKDLADLWHFLRKNPEIEIMKTYPLAKQIGISLLQKRQGENNTFIPYFSAENFCFFYQRKKTQLQETQHHQNPILDTLTVKDLTATSKRTLAAIKSKRLDVFNQHKTIFQTEKEQLRLKSNISKTDLYRDAFKKAPST